MAHHLEDNCIVPSLLTFKSNQTLLVSTVARNKGAWEWWRAAEGERQREREILALCGSSILLSWGQTNKKTNSKQTKILSAIYRGAMFFKPINPVTSRLLRLEFSKRIHTHRDKPPRSLFKSSYLFLISTDEMLSLINTSLSSSSLAQQSQSSCHWPWRGGMI